MPFTFLENLSRQSNGLISVLFLSVLIVVVTLLLSLHKSSILTISTGEQGRVRIRKRALQRLLESVCEGVGGILSAHIHINQRKQVFNIRVRLKTSPDARIEAIQGYLNEEITSILKDNLGIAEEHIGKISIEITSIIPKETPISSAQN